MILKTKRLMLEPLGTKHYESTLKYSTDPENTRMMCFLPCDDGKEVMSYLEKCERQWEMESPEYLDAALICDGVHIGAVSIEFLENGTVGEFGWIIDKRYWGRGYAAEGICAFMKYVYGTYGIDHYIAHCDSENHASVRVMEKIGMIMKKRYRGRKNRGSEEIRDEMLFELYL